MTRSVRSITKMSLVLIAVTIVLVACGSSDTAAIESISPILPPVQVDGTIATPNVELPTTDEAESSNMNYGQQYADSESDIITAIEPETPEPVGEVANDFWEYLLSLPDDTCLPTLLWQEYSVQMSWVASPQWHTNWAFTIAEAEYATSISRSVGLRIPTGTGGHYRFGLVRPWDIEATVLAPAGVEVFQDVYLGSIDILTERGTFTDYMAAIEIHSPRDNPQCFGRSLIAIAHNLHHGLPPNTGNHAPSRQTGGGMMEGKKKQVLPASSGKVRVVPEFRNEPDIEKMVRAFITIANQMAQKQPQAATRLSDRQFSQAA